MHVLKVLVAALLIYVSAEVALSQDTHHDRIATMLAEVSEQRLQDHVRAMEEAGGTRNRVTFTSGKDSAAVYIRLAFEAMPGIDEVHLDTFFIASAVPPFNLKPQVNVIAVMRGTLSADEYFVVGSHYDATADRDAGWNNGQNWQSIQAPGANDNGSGVAALLEMAHIMSAPQFGYRPESTIKFVAFGAEERLPAPVGTGNHFGSRHLARQARLQGHTIRGMVSVDMIGFNERNNYTAIVKVNNEMASASAALGTRYVQANQNFFTGLIMNGFPFANGTYSDHQSYADEGYPAILIIENAAPWNTNTYYTANPYYHMTTDTRDRINYELVRRVTQLNIAALATEAGVATGLTESVFSDLPAAAQLNPNYPNPFNPTTNIPFSLPEASPIRLTVYNAVGQQIAVLADGVWPSGEHIIPFNADGLSSGLYVYRLETTGGLTHSRTMLLVK
jgi:hypothetical protein